MLNKIFLQGRLVADPELRHTQQGTPVASFRLAVDRDFKSKDPNASNTDFINIVAWRGTGEFVSRYFTKGRMAIVEGRLQMREYTDRDGNRRVAAEVVANNVYFGDSRRDSQPAGAPYGAHQGGYDSYGGAPAAPSSYAPPANFGAPSAGAPGNGFAELSDDHGELPF